MSSVQVKDKHFDLFIDSEQIQQKVTEIAEKISEEYRDKNPVFLCVLNGSFIFAADLLRNISIPAEVSFVKFSSYSGTESTGNVKELIGLNAPIADRHIIIVEDIVDSGKTIHELLPIVHGGNPASVKLTSILSKPALRKYEIAIDYLGFEIPDKFVVGYGLDYNEYGRDLPHIYSLSE